VCIVARDVERLEKSVAEIRAVCADPSRIIDFVSIDVRDEGAVKAGVQAALTKLGAIDILINNAGYSIPGYVGLQSEDVYQEMMAVNYFGPVRMILAVLPHMIERKSGAIVNVTSMLGFMGFYGYGAYCGSKFALSGFTECLRQDVLPYGIDVHLCYPPTTKTPGLEREGKTKPAEAWAIEGSSKAFEPEAVALTLVRGIEKRRFSILVGFDSWLFWMLQRLLPWVMRWAMDDILRKHIANKGDGRKALEAAKG
jgi:3-dehydrosphinganine reductase